MSAQITLWFLTHCGSDYASISDTLCFVFCHRSLSKEYRVLSENFTECCPKTLPSADRKLYRVLTEHFYRVLSENFYRVLSENFYRVSSENFYRVPTENFIPSALRELKVSTVTKGSPNCTQAPFVFLAICDEMR